MLLQPLRQALAALGLPGPGERWGVAFSGGGDSLCLLHLLGRIWRESSDLEGLHALIVDHRLREGSQAEAARALELARALGVPGEVLTLTASGRGNLQQRAREARLEALRLRARELGLQHVALGHTATDQAETLLMRATRGAGLQGLAGMDRRAGIFVRPLLTCTRGQVQRYLAAHGLHPVQDPSNLTDRFLRNRLRRRVLPALLAENPRAELALCRLADNCREALQALQQVAQRELQQAQASPGGPVDGARLRDLPPGLRREVLRQIFAQATGDRRRLQRGHLLALEALLGAQRGTALVDLPGIRFVGAYGTLTWERRGPGRPPRGADPALPEILLPGPGAYALGDARTLTVCAAGAGPWPGAGAGQLLDAGQVGFPLRVRGWRRGDRLAVGPAAHRRVSRLFIDRRIPRAQRGQVPLVFSGEELVLVPGLRSAYGFGPIPGQPTLRVQIQTAR